MVVLRLVSSLSQVHSRIFEWLLARPYLRLNPTSGSLHLLCVKPGAKPSHRRSVCGIMRKLEPDEEW